MEIADYRIKMLPGQEPYTAEELERLRAMIEAACLAKETVGIDECEEYARQQRSDNEPPVW